MLSTSGLVFVLLALAVGREGVLSSAWSRELRCGRRLVSGLFSRPRLPLGYSYVATVPRGACRLNVTEIVPNDNYIALKITNGSYIMNGEFAVSAPGTYEAAGARFHYARDGSRDAVFAHGPIHHPIDIMILYTQPNPSIKYEYFTESLPGEVESEAVTKTDLVGVTPATFPATHFRRHHSYEMHSRKSIGGPRQPEISINPEDANADEIIVGNRKFMWKIMSYTQCTRTCGGGIQLGKYRCVEANPSKREVASTHCAGPTPPPSRRKCGTNACPPRWRAAAWTACPRCGPATRTRIVGCVQDHAKGITKISDQKCPLPKPSTSESCVIPDCNVQVGGEVRQITSKRVIKPRDHTDAFKEGPVYTVIVNNTVQDVGPAYSFSASTAGWIYTDWSECVGWCVGGGVQTRGVRCGEASGCSSKAPESKRPCQPKSECAPIDGNWFTGEWSPCSSPCRGKQIRGVLCIGGTGRHLKDTACRMPKPAHERDCSGDCKAMWHYGDWGQCSGNCNTSSSGIQLRTAVCSRGDSVTSDGECSQPRRATRICDLNCVVRPAAAAPKTIAVDIKNQQPLVIESQKASSAGTPQQRSISQRTKDHMTKGNCDDKLNNCFLAVQARLCNYNYYINNCCQSCAGR